MRPRSLLRFGADRRAAARTAARCRAVAESGVFDAAWYVGRYPDVQREQIEPVRHYVLHGAAEGRWPHPLFHGDFYLARNADVGRGGLNPLLHYLDHGWREGRNPNPLFDGTWYARTYMGGAGSGLSPLQHFLRHPEHDPGPGFDARRYLARYPEALAEATDPLSHYFTFGVQRDNAVSPRAEGGPQADLVALRASGLFDGSHYLALHPDLARVGIDPLAHYVEHGIREGRQPHPLFIVDHYLRQCPSAAQEPGGPLLHYIRTGAGAGLNPHPLFATAWYAATYPEHRQAGLTPLAHFLVHGGHATSPSPAFDALWYYRAYPDVAASNINPLVHYVTGGRSEGRSRRLVAGAAGSAFAACEARLVRLKRVPRTRSRTALVVTHAPAGKIKGHVGHYVEALRANGTDVVLIVAADQRRTAVPLSILEACTGVYVRENKGFDFAAWAHVLQVDDDLFDADTLYLTNDSIVGPLDAAAFTAALDAIDRSGDDMVGLTDNHFGEWHLQSFFIALKRRCLSAYALHTFLRAVVNIADKNDVIGEYEVTFGMAMRNAGLKVGALFPMPNLGRFPGNRTIFQWRALLAEGFPFVKGSLLYGEHQARGGQGVEDALAELGFDTRLLASTYTYPGPRAWADLDRPDEAHRPRRVAFVAPMNFANGLGAAARGYVRALQRTGWAASLYPIERPFHVHARTAPAWQAPAFAGPPDVAIVHLNPESWEPLLDDAQRRVIAAARRRIGILVWETSFVPPNWLAVINELDAIWTPSTFCADIFREVTNVPVDVIPHVVDTAPSAEIDAAAARDLCGSLGLDAGRRLILYAFDGSSFLARKNPHALIRAFRASGLHAEGWQLALKTKHLFDARQDGEALLGLVGQHGDVVLVDRPMKASEFDLLFRLCAIYASSHASEGFGLTIAEAMAAGKVVVATDYGGSRDFLDPTCGFPVRADIVALEASHGPYLKGSHWGRVDEDDLTLALRRAADSVVDGRSSALGRAARLRITERLSAAAVAGAMQQSLDRLLADHP
ncbi:rhamnan synthesis F family protein [Methylobacterium sp. A54F]